MNKAVFFLISMLSFSGKLVANTLSVDSDINQLPSSQQQATKTDPFDRDPFFRSSDNLFGEMEKIQQQMHQLMQSHFAQMQNSLANRHQGQTYSNNIQIDEGKDKLVYKIKLPEGSDKKVDVSVKNGQLFISTNVTQKMTHEESNSKSYSYSQSSNTQSFKLPPGYDEKSMTTQMKGKNIIVTLKKASKPIGNKA